MSQHQHINLVRSVMVVVWSLGAIIGSAQTKHDTLNDVQIRAKHKAAAGDDKKDFSTGQTMQTIDSATMQQHSQQSVATMIAQRLPVFVKAYSFNGLATLNFRGSSAAQSQVIWNGIPIQNAALGVADVSALPVMMVNDMSIVYGGSGALYGSGNVGGALLFQTDNTTFGAGHSKQSLSIGGGSFTQLSGAYKGSVNGEKWFASGSASVQYAMNDYKFSNSYGQNERMPNGRVQSAAGTATVARKLNERNTLKISAWGQVYKRQIPPALFESISKKTQNDQSLRAVASWTKTLASGGLYARTSLVHDATDFADSVLPLYSTNAVYQYYQEAGWRQQIGKRSELLLFAPVQISWLQGNDPAVQRRAALAGAFATEIPAARMSASVQFRGEQIDERRVILPGAGVTADITEWLQLRANAQRSYRVPTLNELYYTPGGNPLLQPEEGWSEDAGYKVHFRTNGFVVKHDASVFARQMNNWIMWLGGAIWTPHNIASVNSRGTETETQISRVVGKTRLQLDVASMYVLATTQSSYIPGDGSIGKQIPYTPRYNGRATLSCTWRMWRVSYNHSYTGYRFITTDESSWLNPYKTGNLYASWAKSGHRYTYRFNVQVNNIWNAKYSVAGFRPMPGINWLAGFVVERETSKKGPIDVLIRD
jgi:iron complex outermembrane receptor protein